MSIIGFGSIRKEMCDLLIRVCGGVSLQKICFFNNLEECLRRYL
ncbi:MAG: hypothetical protein QXR19_00170 [Candidatus Jordarchaeaceae archaeon]